MVILGGLVFLLNEVPLYRRSPFASKRPTLELCLGGQPEKTAPRASRQAAVERIRHT